MFMQDSAPCHYSKLVFDFSYEKEYKALDWPDNSLDLNPIENLWTILKDKVADEQLTNAKDLETSIKHILTQNLQLNTATPAA